MATKVTYWRCDSCGKMFRNYEEAYKCFYKASQIGNEEEITEALYKLSDMYDRGYYVKKQRRKAYDIVSKLYKQEHENYSIFRESRYLADLAMRLARAHSKDGVEPDLQEALHFYYQAIYLLNERWDGKWFGDKKLIDTCKKNIIEIKKELYNEDDNPSDLNLIELFYLLNKYEGCFWFKDLIYDEEQKEIYLYITSFGLKTFETVAISGMDSKVCIVIPAKKVKLEEEFINEYRYESRPIQLNIKSFSKKTSLDRWELSIYNEELAMDFPLVSFSNQIECGAYIAYIKDGNYNVLYEDTRYVAPKELDQRYILKFSLNRYGGAVWSLNDKAGDKYGFRIDLDKLPISQKLKKDIQNLSSVFMENIHAELEGIPWDKKKRKSFIEDIETPIVERLSDELGDEYIVAFEREQIQ